MSDRKITLLFIILLITACFLTNALSLIVLKNYFYAGEIRLSLINTLFIFSVSVAPVLFTFTVLFRRMISGPVLLKLKVEKTILEQQNTEMLKKSESNEMAEAALRESESRFKTLVESSPYGICDLNKEGIITFVNSAMTRITGYSENDLCGRTFAEVVPLYIEKERLKCLENILSQKSEPPPHFTKFITKSGGIIDVREDWNYKWDRNGQIDGYNLVTTDISSQKISEMELSWESETNAAIADLASTLLNLSSVEELSMSALEYSRKFTTSRFGYAGHIDPDTGHLVCSTMTKEIWDVCQVEDKSIIFEKFGGMWGWVLDSCKPIMTNNPHGDHRSTGIPDGHIPIEKFLSVPAMIGNKLVGQIAIANPERDFTERDMKFIERVAMIYALAIQRKYSDDKINTLYNELEGRVEMRTRQLQAEVTERMETEKKLLKSRATLQKVIEGISDPLILVDENMKLGMINSAARRYYGKSVDDFIGETCFRALMHREELCEGCTIKSYMKSTENITFERKGIVDPESYEQVSLYRIDDNSNEFRTIIRISDITESKKMQTQLVRADRLASLGQLSGGIAHEIRNPLAGIKLYADILSNGSNRKNTVDIEDIVDEINGNIKKIDSIIRRVLDFAKPPSLSSEVAEMRELIKDTLKLFSTKLRKKKISLELAVGKKHLRVQGDRISLQQVVTNLIINAMDAMEEGGVLKVSARESSSIFYKDRRVTKITVEDTGYGIDHGNLESIFNPFFTTKATGTGLGLSISHQIIERHGGLISVDSVPGMGAKFHIELPMIKEA